jgi:hypothetical protein
MRKLIAIIVTTFLLGVASVAFAQSTEDEENVIYKKKTTVSFEDDTIDGDLTKPDGAYVESRKRVRHSNLIRIRENFDHEIMNSVSRI